MNTYLDVSAMSVFIVFLNAYSNFCITFLWISNKKLPTDIDLKDIL